MPKNQSSVVSHQLSVRGFTLLELIIAVAVLAIISSIGFVGYSQAQISGRDAKRKEDLRSIAAAMEFYYQKNGRYPCTDAEQISSTDKWIVDKMTFCGNGSTADFDKNYISVLPKDPLKNDFNMDTDSTYGYRYNTPGVISGGSGNTCPALVTGATNNAQYFTLITRLENANDPDRCEVKRNKRCDSIDFCPTTNAARKRLYIITSDRFNI